MPIISLAQRAGFKPEDTHILTTAFDQAWSKLKASNSPLAGEGCAAATRALLAKRIIESAQGGKKRVDLLVEDGLSYLAELK